jgi:hypothetical protein
MVVEVFIANSDAEYAMSEHCSLLMNGEEGITLVGNTFVDGIDETDVFINFPQK